MDIVTVSTADIFRRCLRWRASKLRRAVKLPSQTSGTKINPGIRFARIDARCTQLTKCALFIS